MAKMVSSKSGAPSTDNPGPANSNVVEKPSDIWQIINKESSSQNPAIHADDTGPMKARMKYGPAASHEAGNPTSGGGINRPTKGGPGY